MVVIFSIIFALIGWIINNKACTVHVSKQRFRSTAVMRVYDTQI